MPQNLTVNDLMKPLFLRLGASHTLREAMGILLDPQARREDPRVLIVLNADGSFGGILTARDLLKALLPNGAPEMGEKEDADAFAHHLLQTLPEKLNLKVTSAMRSNVPTVTPTHRLPHLIHILQEYRLECVPVVDQGRVLGLVHLTDVFNAAASLALASQPQRPS